MEGVEGTEGRVIGGSQTVGGLTLDERRERRKVEGNGEGVKGRPVGTKESDIGVFEATGRVGFSCLCRTHEAEDEGGVGGSGVGGEWCRGVHSSSATSSATSSASLQPERSSIAIIIEKIVFDFVISSIG